ncbi:MAG: hypothetical protein ACRDF9_04395 [Candidatus Limnocylindria bacterium]
MAPRLELRKGVQVLYRLADGSWLEGSLVRGSTTGEEWLVRNRFGQYWVPVTQLRPSGEPQPGH